MTEITWSKCGSWLTLQVVSSSLQQGKLISRLTPIWKNTLNQKCSVSMTTVLGSGWNERLFRTTLPHWMAFWLCSKCCEYQIKCSANLIFVFMIVQFILSNIAVMIRRWWINNCNDVMMSAVASRINGVSVVRSIVCSGADQRKHQSSASLAFVRGIHRWPVDSPHNGPITRKMFPFDDVIPMLDREWGLRGGCISLCRWQQWRWCGCNQLINVGNYFRDDQFIPSLIYNTAPLSN